MGFWSAECLLDEKVKDGKIYYLVSWLGKDEDGKPWEPSWEPAKNCTDDLIKEWKKRSKPKNDDGKDNENEESKKISASRKNHTNSGKKKR